jgi:hypothetical protein
MMNRNRCIATMLMLPTLALFPVAALFAEENSSDSTEEGTSVYRTEDEYGRPTFSDKNTKGATKIKVREPMTLPAGALTRPSNFPDTAVQSEKDKVRPVYDQLTILQPQHDAAIRSNSGGLTVVPTFSPALHSNHRLQLVIDKQVYATNQGAAFELDNMDRGVHELRLQIVEVGSDQVIKTSNSISISMLRQSIQRKTPKGS